MKKIEADLKYYNANTRNADVGDCVKRGLAVAYSMDYDAVSTELNRIKRKIGASQFNLGTVFKKFMKERGDTFTSVPESEQITADEFCKVHPQGVYVVLLGKRTGAHSSHLAAIVDGNVYDSWDSLNWFVIQYAKVSSGKSDVYEMDGEEVAKQVAQAVADYVDTRLFDKLPDNMSVHVVTSIARDNKYTYELTIRCSLGDVSKYCKYRSGARLLHQITMKLNPRLSPEENLASLTKKCKQKVYDYIYNVKAEILESEKVERLGVNDSFSANNGGALILGKLPDWAIPHILHIYDNGAGYDWGERYEVEMEAIPEDPRYEDNPRVDFYADSIKEMKTRMEWYRDDYSRINYDY